MLQPPETTAQIELWRKKAREGTLTLEESKAIITHLRGNRTSAVVSKPPSRSHQPKPTPISGDDLLADFGI